MPNVLPILRNTSGGLNAQVLYPFERNVSCLTTVTTFHNGSEQRWSNRPPLFHFSLPMSSLLSADKAAWLAFFEVQKGRFNQDLELSLGATTYSDLTLLSDVLNQRNARTLQYDQQIALRQVQQFPYTPPAAGSSYPLLKFHTGSPTARVEMPFEERAEFLTSVNDSPYGQRFAFAWYESGLVNFPAKYLRTWKLSYPLLDDEDLLTLETFFLGQQGRFGSFDFTDPLDSTVYHHVRFDQDDLTVRYLTKNQSHTEVMLRQTFVT